MPRTDSLCSRLHSIEDELFAAIDGDDHMMETFCDTWASLQHDIQRAEATGVLTQEMAELAYAVSVRVSTIAEAFHGMDEAAQELSNELDVELELLVGDSLRGGTRSKDESYSVSRSAPYIRLGYAWLLENLHNPYPSKGVKEVFAKESGSSVKLIDSWFVDVRKRIGWSKIKREHFQNKRKTLVDAATKFFVTGLPLPEIIGAEFAEMAGIAKDLYSHKFCQSDLATKLASEQPDRFSSPSQLRSPCPSPRQSSGYSCSSSSSPDTIGRGVMTNSPMTLHSTGACGVVSTTRKRARPEDIHELGYEPQSRGNKRARYELSPALASQNAILSSTPSPVAFQSSLSLVADTYRTSPPRTLPKRRISDSSNQIRPKDLPAAGRIAGLQTASTLIVPSAPRKHAGKSNSPSTMINDAILPNSGAIQSFTSNTSSNEAATVTAQTSSRSPTLQQDYALPSMTYPYPAVLPGPVNCVQPTMDAIDLSLLSNDFFQNCQLPLPPSDGNDLFTIPTAFEGTTPPPNNDIDLTSLSGLFGTLGDNQSFNTLSMPSNLDYIITPPTQSDSFLGFTEVDINLSSFFSTLPTSSGRLPEPPVNDPLYPLEYNTKFSGAPSADPSQAKKLAQLEQLRRYGTHVQECIRSLESQIAV